MKTQINTIKPEEFGLDKKRGNEIAKAFEPLAEQFKSLEASYEEVIKLPMTPETYKKAKAIRLEFKRLRMEVEKIHKEKKAFYLAGSKYVDAWRREHRDFSQEREKHLEEIEKHEELERQKKIDKLQNERHDIMTQYEYEPDEIPSNLGEMSEAVWKNFLTGIRANYEAKKKAEQEEEQKRIAEEEKLEKERQKIEAERKKQEAITKELQRRDNLIAPFRFVQSASDVDYTQMPSEKFDEYLSELKERKEEYDQRQRKREERYQVMQPLFQYMEHTVSTDEILDMPDDEFEMFHSSLKKKKAIADRKRAQEQAEKEALERKNKVRSELKKRRKDEIKSLEYLAEAVGYMDMPQVHSDEAKEIVEFARKKLSEISTQISHKVRTLAEKREKETVKQ